MLFEFFTGQNLLVSGLYILVTLFLATEIGYRSGCYLNRNKEQDIIEKEEKGVSTITSAMLALVAFTLAVSISMADNRFETRRRLVLEEGKAIGTARLRAIAVGGDHGNEIARLLDDYTRLRIDSVKAGEDPKRLKAFYGRTEELQNKIWGHARSLTSLAPNPITALLLASLNQVFDMTTARRWAFELRVPLPVFKFLHFSAFLGLMVMGYYFSLRRHRHWVLSFVFLFAFTASILLILDLDQPRTGNITAEQSPLIWLLESAKGDQQGGQ